MNSPVEDIPVTRPEFLSSLVHEAAHVIKGSSGSMFGLRGGDR
jgi:hypothetical protein